MFRTDVRREARMNLEQTEMMIMNVAEYFIACSSLQRCGRPTPLQVKSAPGNRENRDFSFFQRKKRRITIHSKSNFLELHCMLFNVEMNGVK